MSETFTVGSVRELVRLIAKHQTARERKVRVGALRKAAAKGVTHVKKNIPVAHGELRESVHREDAKVVVDAPHAASVNKGSRPHWPPLAPLIEWVKLRGMQGLRSSRQIGRLPGSSTAGSARAVAGMLAGHVSGGASSVDAPEQVARAIQRAIAARGTKPHHFIEKSLPAIFRLVDEEVKRALGMGAEAPVGDPGSGDGGGARKTRRP